MLLYDEDVLQPLLDEARRKSNELVGLPELQQFQNRLDYLDAQGITVLFPDFTPYGFQWATYARGENGRRGLTANDPLVRRYPQLLGCHPVLRGGLIFHGRLEPHENPQPTFTVTLSNTAGWQLHT